MVDIVVDRDISMDNHFSNIVNLKHNFKFAR